jgi:hypothetical protein
MGRLNKVIFYSEFLDGEIKHGNFLVSMRGVKMNKHCHFHIKQTGQAGNLVYREDSWIPSSRQERQQNSKSA